MCWLRWQPPALAFTAPAGRNTGLQGQRLHLSIYHPDWLAKSTSCSPSLPLPYPSSSLSVSHSPHTHSIPASSASDPASPIYPSIHLLSSTIYLSFSAIRPMPHPSLPVSLLCVFLFPSSPSPLARAASVWGLSWNVLREPVSNTGTRNIWHIFNSQGQLQLFIQRLQLNFPRFLLDLPQIAMCVCHIF